jgi:hypothetical protein
VNRGLLALSVALPLVLAPTAEAAVVTKLTATSHTPKVGQAWQWTVTATDGGKPAGAKARVQIEVFGRVVGCLKGGQMKQCTGANAGDLMSFVGSKKGTIRWPAESRGVTVTFQAVVTAGGKTTKLRYPVTVK